MTIYDHEDAVPLSVVCQRRAKAAVDAASTAVNSVFTYYTGTEANAARIEAVGRIAAALIAKMENDDR